MFEEDIVWKIEGYGINAMNAYEFTKQLLRHE
jgi:hypothetical protein